MLLAEFVEPQRAGRREGRDLLPLKGQYGPLPVVCPVATAGRAEADNEGTT